MNFYRYERAVTYFDEYSEPSVDFVLREYTDIAETRCGYWVVPSGYEYLANKNPEFAKKKRRFVLKTGRKRYCYPTKEQAWRSFVIRSKRSVEHCERHLRESKAVLKKVLENK
jgi:hypothetical protein